MTAAAVPLPSDAKRALRPNRSPIASGPTRPRLIAAIAGPRTQLAAACRVAAAATTGKIGHAAYPSAHIPIVATARPATSRSERAASTMAPPGICPISPTRPPIDSTRPISTWVHFCVVRYTAMNGPKPVCTSARKKMNQSSPRKLWRDGVDAGGSASGSGAGGATFSVSIGRPRRSRSIRSIECRDERANRISLRPQGPYCRGCRLPDAPSTTIGASSLYSGAALTCSLVNSSEMLSLLLPMRQKRNAFQSTTIFRLPTPRKPPKSMTAARTWPARSTTTSTIRPISSSAALRTSRPSTPCASAAPMIVTEGGGTPSFGAATAGAVFGGAALGLACGTTVSSAAQDATAANDAKTIIVNTNGRLARIWPPVHRRASVPRAVQASQVQPVVDGWSPTARGYQRGSAIKVRIFHAQRLTDTDKVSPRSMRENDRHLNLAARTQNFQRHVIAVATDPQSDARRTQLQFAQDHFVKEYWQARVAQPNFAAPCVEFETECGFQQRKRRRARPGLRRASNRVQRRAAASFTLKPAEQFGEPPQIHIARGIEQALEHMFDRMLQPVAREAERYQRIVVRPDRSIVIGNRIVACFATRDG